MLMLKIKKTTEEQFANEPIQVEVSLEIMSLRCIKS